MDFDRLLDKCVALENTIFSIIKNNARKQTELSLLQTEILKTSLSESEALVDFQHELGDQLEVIKSKKEELDTEIKLYNGVNEKLEEIVATAQRSSKEKKDFCYSFQKEFEEFEQIKEDRLKILDDFTMLKEENTQKFKECLSESRNLVISLYKNDQIIRVLESQNKYAEQQFDFILNEVPWQPLPDHYFIELRDHKDHSIRNIAETLKIQTAEIRDLNESLDTKKERKLEILERLARQLDLFVRKRESALLIDNRQVESI